GPFCIGELSYSVLEEQPSLSAIISCIRQYNPFSDPLSARAFAAVRATNKAALWVLAIALRLLPPHESGHLVRLAHPGKGGVDEHLQFFGPALDCGIMHKLFLIFTLLIPLLSYAQGRNYSSDYKGEREPAFEKIYVQRSDIVTMPDGVYYYDKDEGMCKVRAFSADCDGLYVIRINHQCTLCGRCYEGKYLDEEYGCPLFQRRVSSWLWSD
ncbi:MAG: hypothetical protein LLG04_12525, partial [Parachlamydia sp.]|nr:hypothetical protein [Parachlamydia sp.]